MFPPARGRRRWCPIRGSRCNAFSGPGRSAALRRVFCGAVRAERRPGSEKVVSEGGLWFRLLWFEKVLEGDVPVRRFRDKLKLSAVREHVQLDDLGRGLHVPPC